jgi:N-hydroxyarylamine O-acetyltransferase
MNDAKIDGYLRRIHFDGAPDTSFDTLCALQQLHLLHIPYENLDIMRGIPLSLEFDDLYNKLVTRRRGGYCFELNGAFAWLLRALGFGVTEYMARFLRDETEIPMRRHRVLDVTCRDGKNYLCDVGVGGIIPRKPLPLVCGLTCVQGGEQYKLEAEPFLGYVLYEWKKDAWHRLYAFTTEPQLNLDYVMPSYYCENHPQSYFKTMDMVHVFTPDGRKTVADREVKLFSPEGVVVLCPQSEAEYEGLLAEHFGVRMR